MKQPDLAKSSTKETTPWLIWREEVLAEAARMGFHAGTWQEYNERIRRAYLAGEPVWMMAVELRDSGHARRIAERGDREVNELRHAVHAGLGIKAKRRKEGKRS